MAKRRYSIAFCGPPSDGQAPAYTILLRESNDNLYGTTPNGAFTDQGTAYKLSPAGGFVRVGNPLGAAEVVLGALL
jgi:uncharacterized repeat protein (TIGR03803 family)